MGDMSGEPSMEEILSSIKRIIAEEGEGPIRGRRAGRPTPPPQIDPIDDEDAEILELSDAMHAAPAPAPPLPAPPIVEPRAAERQPEPVMTAPAEPRPADPQTARAEPLASPRTAEASRSALDSLSRLMVKSEPGSDGSLEGLVREMLRPMLREWLDLHLPALVESMVETEIARITGQER